MQDAKNTLPEGSAAALYESLAAYDRERYLKRARDCALLTIPSLALPLGHTPATDEYTPYQSVGSRGINNLSSKLLLALLPTNVPFFQYSISEFVEDQMSGGDGQMKADIEAGLNKMSRAIQSYVEGNLVSVTAFEAFKNLLGNGNVLFHLPDDGGSKMYTLEQYVVQRDTSGNAKRIIIKEMVAKAMLNPEQRLLAEQKGEDLSSAPAIGDSTTSQDATPGSHEKDVSLYTDIKLMDSGKMWIVQQEIKGVVVPGTLGTYPKDQCAYRALRFRKIDGENYGRGFSEEHIGDLRSLEGLRQSLVEGGAAMSKILFLVNPNGLTSKKMLSEAPNMAIREGRAEDVTTLQANKAFDMQFVERVALSIQRDLELAFLLNTAVQRDAERVTAEEIRYVAQELEQSLGGVYSILAPEFQVWLVERISHILQKKNQLPKLPKDTVKPKIIAGLEALGRGADLNRLDTFVDGIKNELGPEAIAQYININVYLTRRATALGLDPKDLIKTQAEIDAEAQQAQTKSLVDKVAPEAVKQMGNYVNNRASEAATTAPAPQSQPTNQ